MNTTEETPIKTFERFLGLSDSDWDEAEAFEKENPGVTHRLTYSCTTGKVSRIEFYQPMKTEPEKEVRHELAEELKANTTADCAEVLEMEFAEIGTSVVVHDEEGHIRAVDIVTSVGISAHIDAEEEEIPEAIERAWRDPARFERKEVA